VISSAKVLLIIRISFGEPHALVRFESANDRPRFEAFDEPWKISLNEPGKEWEDKWGLMDSGRKLKPGLKIPDCGGKGID